MGWCEGKTRAVQAYYCPFYPQPIARIINTPVPSHMPTCFPDRTEAFLWRLPLPHENPTELCGNNLVEVDIPKLPDNATHGSTYAGRRVRERYQYLGSMPDFHSSEVTAISVRLPLLATGLANGRIFLWR